MDTDVSSILCRLYTRTARIALAAAVAGTGCEDATASVAVAAAARTHPQSWGFRPGLVGTRPPARQAVLLGARQTLCLVGQDTSKCYRWLRCVRTFHSRLHWRSGVSPSLSRLTARSTGPVVTLSKDRITFTDPWMRVVRWFGAGFEDSATRCPARLWGPPHAGKACLWLLPVCSPSSIFNIFSVWGRQFLWCPHRELS